MNNADQLKQMRRTLQNMNKMVENTIEALNYLIPIIEKTDELLDDFCNEAKEDEAINGLIDDASYFKDKLISEEMRMREDER